MAKSSGNESTWKWVLVAVALTFLGLYLINNLKPGKFIDPVVIPGWTQASPQPLPSDVELVPLGEEEAAYY